VRLLLLICTWISCEKKTRFTGAGTLRNTRVTGSREDVACLEDERGARELRDEVVDGLRRREVCGAAKIARHSTHGETQMSSK